MARKQADSQVTAVSRVPHLRLHIGTSGWSTFAFCPGHDAVRSGPALVQVRPTSGPAGRRESQMRCGLTRLRAWRGHIDCLAGRDRCRNAVGEKAIRRLR